MKKLFITGVSSLALVSILSANVLPLSDSLGLSSKTVQALPMTVTALDNHEHSESGITDYFNPKHVRSSKILNHGHTGYTCYRITTKMSAADVKKIAAQSNSITEATKWAAILAGFGAKGWIGGLIAIFGESVQSQMKPFRDAAAKGKGLKYTYDSHFSNYTTDIYSDNWKFAQV